ncbi:MAG: peptide-methionine (S)-S-oxide reductase MsrA [bacterium]
METIVLGGGCFWCIQAVFSDLPGIISVRSGYAGGYTDQPSYEDVCTGNTGHAEVVELQFDPIIISLEKILNTFFKSHDPTSINKQGNDTGTQYRSVILFTKDSQKPDIFQIIDKIQKRYTEPIVTEVVKLIKFYEAEPDHQQFFKKNPENSYCKYVIAPKLRK